ncbi:MAG: hypothetical protein AAGC58_05415, partial [Asticcacaulis sp.]
APDRPGLDAAVTMRLSPRTCGGWPTKTPLASSSASSSFSKSLIEVSDKAEEFAAIKQIARDRIFNAPRKTELEIYGRNVIWRIMNGLMPVLDDLERCGWDVTRLSPYHQQLVRAFHLDLEGIDTPYDAVHALTDFVSGMTDRYAVKVADMLGA